MGTRTALTRAQTTTTQPVRNADEQERLVRQLLAEVETLYERNTNPLLLTHPRRRRWGFVRALGATRLAHVLNASRDAVVEARRLAFYRWRYWFFRYESTLWSEIAQRGAQEWERNLLHYLGVRTALRSGKLGTRGGIFLAWALRSLSTVTWRSHDCGCTWQQVWIALARGAFSDAHTLAEQLHWRDRQWRRARQAVKRLGPLVWLPFTQRQLLAVSTWPASHLQALRQHGQALFPQHTLVLEQLRLLTPSAIRAMSRTSQE
jgi:hypothetical protein